MGALATDTLVSNPRRPGDRRINRYLDMITRIDDKIVNIDMRVKGTVSTNPNVRLPESFPALTTSSRLPGGPNFHEPVKASDEPPPSPLSSGILRPDLCPFAARLTSHLIGRCMPAT